MSSIYYMHYRENFDDQFGWYTKEQLEKEVIRIRSLADDGEACIYTIIIGRDITSDFISEIEW